MEQAPSLQWCSDMQQFVALLSKTDQHIFEVNNSLQDPPNSGRIKAYCHASMMNSGGIAMKTVEVAAAVIIGEKGVFATQRGYGAFKDGWEFPGGKLEPGETPEQALVREIREELNTTVKVGRLIQTVEYDYPEFHLKMHCFLCTILEGKLEMLEHEACRWVKSEEIEQLDWLPADRRVLPAVNDIFLAE